MKEIVLYTKVGQELLKFVAENVTIEEAQAWVAEELMNAGTYTAAPVFAVIQGGKS